MTMSAAIQHAIDVIPDEVRQYGAIPWRGTRDGGTEILLSALRHCGRWRLPIGCLAEGRAPFVSAALVAFDEAGIIGDIHPHPLAELNALGELQDGIVRRCRVTLYSFHVRGTLVNWPGRGERTRRWFTLNEAAGVLDEPQLAGVVREIERSPEMLTRAGGGSSREQRQADGPGHT